VTGDRPARPQSSEKGERMYARTISSYLIPRKADEAIRIFRDRVVPVVRGQPGYLSTAIYIDREHDRAQTVSVWESQEAERATTRGSEYLTKVVGMLDGCLVNRDYATWEVGWSDQA
jgi:heme-degrading monooxygenase HmoA